MVSIARGFSHGTISKIFMVAPAYLKKSSGFQVQLQMLFLEHDAGEFDRPSTLVHFIITPAFRMDSYNDCMFGDRCTSMPNDASIFEIEPKALS